MEPQTEGVTSPVCGGDTDQKPVSNHAVDLSRVAVCGGSHGGFLTGHLLGQKPDLFRCGIMRNPVCNISLMVNITDIPDWCYVEVFGPEEGNKRFSVNPTGEASPSWQWASSASAQQERRGVH